MGSYCFPKGTGEGFAGSGWLREHRICLGSPRPSSWLSSLDTCPSGTILCSFDFWDFHVPLLVLSHPSSPVPNPLNQSCDLQGSTLVFLALPWDGGREELSPAVLCVITFHPSVLCQVTLLRRSSALKDRDCCFQALQCGLDSAGLCFLRQGLTP